MPLDRLPLADIAPNPNQPRKLFRKDKLEELAASIEEHGLLEPIVVARRGRKWQIIMGERRWRACRMTRRYQSQPVPVRVMVTSDAKIAEMALIENIQREDLTPLEEARHMQALLDRGLSMAELAKKLGFKSHARVYFRTILLNLLPEYQEALRCGIISHAQAIEMSRLNPENQQRLFDLIKAGKAQDPGKLRSLAGSLLNREQQGVMFVAEPTEHERKVLGKYDRLVGAILKLVENSLNGEDLSLLKTVLASNLSLNIDRLDLIIKHLHKIKSAMVEAQGAQEVLRAVS
ncbi:MAG: ParB/RepB/Spo0J family partition protein [Pseudomonadota bacterium]